MSMMQKIRNFFVLEEEELPEGPEHDKSRWKGKLVGLTSSRHNTILIVEPGSIAEAHEVGNHLKNRAAVLLNLEGLDPQLATRVLDFINGMTYALSGTMQKISDTIYLFAPSTFNVVVPAKRMTYKDLPETRFSL